MSEQAAVTAKNLVKRYGDFTAVNDTSFTIKKGECFGFLGPNGAGKTTTMRIISCFYPPSSGTVEVLGMNVMDEARRIKARLGIMPQEDNLDPDLSVRQNLGVYANYFGITGENRKTRVTNLLEYVELAQWQHRKIDTLSGGMKRRLLLARSLLNDPSILMLDEPTTGLDPHSRRVVWNKVNELKEQGVTIIITTHYMDEAEHLCDRVAMADKGKIVTIDTPANLMETHGGNLEHVYLQVTGRSLED